VNVADARPSWVPPLETAASQRATPLRDQPTARRLSLPPCFRSDAVENHPARAPPNALAAFPLRQQRRRPAGVAGAAAPISPTRSPPPRGTTASGIPGASRGPWWGERPARGRAVSKCKPAPNALIRRDPTGRTGGNYSATIIPAVRESVAAFLASKRACRGPA